MSKTREYGTTVENKVYVLDKSNETKYQSKKNAEEEETDFLKIASKIRRVDIERYFEKL